MILLGRKLVKPVVQTMAEAIMDFEGWYYGSVSQRNNNPGNIKYRGQKGAVGKDSQGHAIFETFEAGWNALINQLNLAFDNASAVYNNDMSLIAFFSKYAEQNAIPYAAYVAERLGVTPSTKLKDLIG